MGRVKVAKRMARSKMVRDLDGSIIDWVHPQFGTIVRKGEIVNEEAWNGFVQKELDKKEAAQAASKQREVQDQRIIDERKQVPAPSKIEEIEKTLNDKIDQKFDEIKKDVDNKFDQILNALKK